jgi:hypothetical protein
VDSDVQPGLSPQLTDRRVDQGGLAMVDVGDDRDVPELGHGGNGRGSRFELNAFCAPRVTSAVLASGVMTDERIDELIDGLTYEPTEDEKELERRVAKRRELLDHIDWQIRPPAWFYEQLEQAIDLAAQGHDGELVEIDCHRRTVTEVIDDWKLEEFVERARTPRHRGRDYGKGLAAAILRQAGLK